MRVESVRTIRQLVLATLIATVFQAASRAKQEVLDSNDFAHHVTKFNSLDAGKADTFIPNSKAWNWIADNVPLFSCPDPQLEETYYFRWWTFRKHINNTPHGFVVTEFLKPVSHAGPFNTISCAFGHHLAEGAWIRDRRILDDYTRFWFHSGPNGGIAPHFHKYSSWAAAAIRSRSLVTGDDRLSIELLDDLVRDYELWEAERLGPNGLYWQFDVRDGMEESISGSRMKKNVRPTINSYMAANARAIASIATIANRKKLAARFTSKYEKLRARMIDQLWDNNAEFFKVRFEDGNLSDAREAIGFVPWMFDLAQYDHAIAWRQFKDPAGFFAPRGLTTAERRHPAFRTHGTGTCEWDGAVWPFATSQTLNGLINLLRAKPQPYVTRHDLLDAMQTYARSHSNDGKPYIGEYLDELTGNWLITGPKAARSRDYNHSTFCDLVIRGLVGIVPRDDDIVEIDPLLPMNTWNWFCLDGIPYHGRLLTVVWDRAGDKYNRGSGLAIWVDGQEITRSRTLARLTAQLPAKRSTK